VTTPPPHSPLDALLRQALARLACQEQRAELLEATLLALAPWSAPPRDDPLTRTPLPARWDTRTPADLADRLRAAEDRARAAEELLRQAGRRLREARRLEAVGRLAAGIAHDFNNLLTIISGHAELVRDGLPAADRLRESAELIVATARTAAGFTRQLLASARPSPPEPCPIDLSAAVRGLDRVLRRLVGNRARLDLDLAPSVHPVLADPGHVDQVLLNLVINARDALTGEAGVVAVRTADAVIEATGSGWPDAVPPGRYVALTVSDTGCGMADEVRARIFEPFFTTKGDRGHGVGLATVRDAVREAGGYIEVESACGRGTNVRVFWPQAGG
jgi:signal transduction histidine kinase